MKRTYPYSAGPTNGAGGAAQQSGGAAALAQQNASGTQATDYSAYGYGNTTASTTNDAQQAQWHQQWQQYYAQQAAAAATAPQQASSVAVQQQPANGGVRVGVGVAPSQAYGYGAPNVQQQQQQPVQSPSQSRQHPQQQAQQQQQFYGQYSPQQPQAGTSAYAPWNAGAPAPATGQQANNYVMQGQAGIYQPSSHALMQPPLPPQQQPAGYYNAGSNSPSANAAKRARLDQGGYGAPTQAYGSHGAGAQQAHPAHGWQHSSPPPQRYPAAAPPSITSAPRTGAQPHPIPGRPMIGTPHAGGPSNMAGPMAEPVRNLGMPQRPLGGRSGRNQHDNPRGGRGGQQHGGSANGSNSGAGGRFTGPVGVNAVGPASGAGRAGFGQRSQPTTRKGQPGGVRGGRPEPARKDDDALSAGPIPKGPAAAKTAAESGLEMDKAPLLQGRSSTPIDHPVPITAKRTFTDFRINGIEIDPIQWQWHRDDDEANENAAVDGSDATGDQASQAGASSTVENASRTSKSRNRRRPRSKASKAGQQTAAGSRRETLGTGARMRLAFVGNSPPAGAPTGPRALVSSTETTPREGKAEGDEKTVDDDDDDEHKEEATTDQSLEWTAFSKGPPQCSANRLTITYGASKRRLVIDSEVVKSVEVNRAQGTVRVVVDVTTSAGMKRKDQQDKTKGEEWVVAKGVVLEARPSETDNFTVVSRRELEKAWNDTSVVADEKENVEVKTEENEADDDESMEPKAETDDARDEETAATTAVENGKVQVKNEGEDVSLDSAVDAPAGARDDVGGEKKEEPDTAGDEVKVLDDYESLPPFYRLLSKHEGPEDDMDHAAADASELCITVFLDDLTNEAKWIRTGDAAEWLAALPGMQTSLTSDPLRAWVDKVRVVDPDPAPTLMDVFDEWVKKSIAGTALLRRQFLQDHQMGTATGLSEVFARLIVAAQGGDRGAASAPSHHGLPSVGVASVAVTPGAKELGKPLQDSLAGTAFDAHHTHVSLAVLSMMQMLRDVAPSDDAVSTRLQDLLLCMPMHLIFRSLDDLCKDSLDKQRLLQAKSRRGKQAQVRLHVAGGGEADASGAGADSAGPSSRAGSVGVASVAPEEQRLGEPEAETQSQSHTEEQTMNDAKTTTTTTALPQDDAAIKSEHGGEDSAQVENVEALPRNATFEGEQQPDVAAAADAAGEHIAALTAAEVLPVSTPAAPDQQAMAAGDAARVDDGDASAAAGEGEAAS